MLGKYFTATSCAERHSTAPKNTTRRINPFLLPFFGLMSRQSKRTPAVLTGWAVWILIMHSVDLYWIIGPQLSPEAVAFGVAEALALIGVCGLYVSVLVHVAGRRALVPIGDPALAKSLAFHNV